MKLICLIEANAIDKKLDTAHALSFYIELFGERILFDTGDDSATLTNAKMLGIPVNKISSIVISHNHMAHIGGAPAFLKASPKAKVFLKASGQGDFSIKTGMFKRTISISPNFFKKYEKNLILFTRFSEVNERFYLASVETTDKKLENLDKAYYRNDGLKSENDDFTHECFAVAFPKENKNDGLVIITGCAHQGINNIITTVQKRWTGIPILGVVGGFHLMKNTPNTLNCSEGHVTALGKMLSQTNVKRFYTCHCTGTKGFDLLADELGRRISYFSAGEEINF